MKRFIFCAFVAIAGCSFTEPPPMTMNDCRVDDDCAGTAMCDRERSMCVATTDVEMNVSFEVASAGGLATRFATSSFPAQTVRGATERDLNIPPSVTAIGNVSWGERRVPAKLTFVPVEEFAVSVSANTFPDRIDAADGEQADYAAQVVAGARYELLVEPTGERVPGTDVPWLRTLPPLRVPDFQTPDVDTNGDLFVRVNVRYPDEIDVACDARRTVACHFRGQVVSASEREPMPESGLQVRALDLNGRVVSSTALTDADGVFSLALAPNAEGYVLRITGGAMRPEFPTVTADPAFFFPGESPPRVLVPQLDIVTYIGRVETEDGTAALAATLTFESNDVFDDDIQIGGTFRTTAMTDRTGRFEVELLRGTYDVIVSSGPVEVEGGLVTREPAVYAQSVRIDPPEGSRVLMGQLFTLPERARFGGEVVTADLLPMDNAAVESIARNLPGMADVSRAALYNRSNDAITDETGQFDLRLDIGSYDILIKPPAGRGYAWIVVPDVVIGSVGATAPTFSGRYEFAAPVPVRGVVRAADGTALSEADVRAFAEIVDGETTRRIPLGRAMTNADGVYEILVPPRL